MKARYSSWFSAQLQERYDAQETTTRCAQCGWSYEGTASDGRVAFRDHRAKWHPKVGGKR